MRALLTCGTIKAAVVLSLWPAALPATGEQGKETNEIISNNMRLLCGGGDTLWLACLSQQGWGVNYTTNQGETWWGCYPGPERDLYDIAFGNGTFVAVLNPPDIWSNRWQPTRIWRYSFSAAGGKIGTFDISWPDTLFKADTQAMTNAVDAVCANGDFYFACQNGGIVGWNPRTNAPQGFIPGTAAPFKPAVFKPSKDDYPLYGTPAANVFAVDRFQSGARTKILAVTAPRVWLFDPADSSWDSSAVGTGLADSTLSFGRYTHTFVNNASKEPVLYAFIRHTKSGGKDSLLSLFRYRFAARQWTLAVKDAPRVIAPAVRGYLYAVHGGNRIVAYRDSLADTVPAPPGGLTPIITEEEMYSRLTAKKNIDRPDSLNDMLFVPSSDSSGRFYIAAYASNASSDGLYCSFHEVPGVTADEFKLLRHARVISSGLKQTYALPGIISDDYQWQEQRSRARFIYKLSTDAKVTIRVYDFNLQLVKTVVENAWRKAAPASGRSTNDKEDVWDGATGSGRPAAPGVYYYKITASTGERSFGKIVVAKGPGH